MRSARVELHSEEPSAFDATRSVVNQLGGTLYRAEDGSYWIDGSDYVIWAAERQGYVKSVLSGASEVPK